MTRSHKVRVLVSRDEPGTSPINSMTIDEILAYSVRSDMQNVADDFSFEIPVSKALWDAVQPDNLIEIFIDNSQVMFGYIDSRSKSADSITVTGRDKGGRLVDERAPLVDFGGRTKLEDLFIQMAGVWFDKVTLVNTQNRAIIGGRGRKRNTIRGGEPVFTPADQGYRKSVNPGERRADVMIDIAEQAGILFWSTADGRELFVGLPNQTQEPTWWFFSAPPGAPRHLESNVLEMTTTEDISEYFSEITVVGTSAQGRPTQRKATVFDQDKAGGIGGRFIRPKRHLIADQDLKNPDEAAERALRERAELGAAVETVEISVAGHGQFVERNQIAAIFHFDTVARVEDDEIGKQGDYYVTGLLYEGNRDTDSTSLTMVPIGTELRVNG